MPDSLKSDNPTVKKEASDGSKSIFGSEIGDDWGEAFEADDFMISPEENISDEFFLEDETEEDTASNKNEEPDSGKDAKASPENGTTGPAVFVAALLNQIKPLANRARNIFLSLPVLFKISLFASFFLVFLVAFFFLRTTSTESPYLPGGALKEGETPASTPEKVAALGSPAKEETSQEKISKKWNFPSFLISTSDEMKGDDIFFVEVDITLILLLKEEEDLPLEKSIFVRDIIYQFFNNRPLYELRRYSLARGEMNRKLRSWIEKQWPEGEIAAIVFNRYQVL